MFHLYLSYQPSPSAMSAERAGMERWCEAGGISDHRIIEERLNHRRISQGDVEKLLSGVNSGDTLITPSLSRLGRSLNMLIKVLQTLSRKGVTLQTTEDGKVYTSAEIIPLVATLEYVSALEITIKSERSIETASDKAGRPVGSKNAPEKNVLFGKTEELVSLRKQGVTITEIASRLEVSRGTVSNYLNALGT